MRLTLNAFFAALMLCIMPSIGQCYAPPDPIEMAKRFAQIEALSNSKAQLISICDSEKERLQARRFALRLLSRVAGTADLESIKPNAYLLPYLDLAKIRVKGRESKATKTQIAKDMLKYLAEVTGASKVEVSSKKYIIMNELGFYIADEQLPQQLFSDEIIKSSIEIALVRLTQQAKPYKDPVKKAEYLASRLGKENPFGVEAVNALIGEIGHKALPVVERMLKEHPVTSNPPPWTPNTNIYSSAIRILSAIGGEKAHALLEPYAKSELPYVSANALGALEWVEAGVKSPLKYMRLFQHPYLFE